MWIMMYCDATQVEIQNIHFNPYIMFDYDVPDTTVRHDAHVGPLMYMMYARYECTLGRHPSSGLAARVVHVVAVFAIFHLMMLHVNCILFGTV
jgi:hypothetical protein